jgi:ketosteroid isomerase-like protein
MSIADNKQVVLAFLDAVKTRDAAALDALLAEDGAFWVITAGTLTKPAFMGAIRMLWDVMDGPAEVKVEYLTAKEDRVSMAGTGNMVSKTGAPYCNKYHVLAFVEHGRIRRWREYFDTRIAAAAFGPAPRQD